MRVQDPTVRDFGGNIVAMLVSKVAALRAEGKLTTAEENRAAALFRSASDLQAHLPQPKRA